MWLLSQQLFPFETPTRAEQLHDKKTSKDIPMAEHAPELHKATFLPLSPLAVVILPLVSHRPRFPFRLPVWPESMTLPQEHTDTSVRQILTLSSICIYLIKVEYRSMKRIMKWWNGCCTAAKSMLPARGLAFTEANICNIHFLA